MSEWETVKLTKQAIDALVHDETKGGKDIRWDEALAGFGVRVYPTGVKSFVLFYRSNGRQRFMALGRYGVLTLDQARDKAKKVLADALDGGDALTDFWRATPSASRRAGGRTRVGLRD